jgi:putative ABC transport system substrate-binding protein
MNRREFITLLGGAATAWPLAARGQEASKIPRIGMLSPGPYELAATSDAFQQEVRELGYTEGPRSRAAELVASNVDLIVARSTTAARVAKEATETIPIVAVAMADPIEDGLVASLARPGGNVTGTTFLSPELVAKRLQLLRDVIPGLSRVAALWHPRAYSERTMAGILKEVEAAAQTLGLQLHLVPAVAPDEFAGALSAMTSERADAFIVLPSPMLFGEYRQIVSLTASSRLPAMYQAREFVDAGGLMSYGANLPDLFRRTATYVDKILKGAKPADLPVEQPAKFELVINLKTARELGLTITRDFLLVADEVIE